MAGINVTGLVNTAKNVQKPVSLAAVALLVLYLIFSQIISKMASVDQAVLPAIVSWIGVIALVAVVMSIMSYTLPLLLKGRAGELEVGAPTVTNPGTSTKPPRAGGGSGT
ncbi:hypothetical protein GOC53_05485 [Sinorhizobium medicae]|nr:hypothetical protein [Sinorhizobium medicae]MDX0539645.1 hypothetical protein [Sinorhizobium medicae]